MGCRLSCTGQHWVGSEHRRNMRPDLHFKKSNLVNSLVVQRLGLGAFTAGALVVESRHATKINKCISSVQFSSVAQSCPTLCNPMNRSTPGLPVHHQLLEFTQTHIHRVSDAIQPYMYTKNKNKK